jgi:multicomponent Na+:H+ antiporter subunit D
MLRYPGITILMLSALLTAGYLLPLVTNGFFPGKDFSRQQPYTTFKQKDTWLMWISMSVLAVAVIVLGMFPGLLEPAVQAIIGPLF